MNQIKILINDEYEMTLAEAERAYKQLRTLFGKKNDTPAYVIPANLIPSLLDGDTDNDNPFKA